LCGIGVTSSIARIFSPDAASERMADSRPAPGPLTRTSTSRTPIFIAFSATFSAAFCAAKGVLLREPLKPIVPAESQQSVSPRGVRDRDDRVVERRLHVHDRARHVALDLARRGGRGGRSAERRRRARAMRRGFPDSSA
jgi:hypothetical protein